MILGYAPALDSRTQVHITWLVTKQGNKQGKPILLCDEAVVWDVCKCEEFLRMNEKMESIAHLLWARPARVLVQRLQGVVRMAGLTGSGP